MMNNLSIEQYVGVSQAAAMFGMFLPEHAEDYPGLTVLSADMSVAASLDRFVVQCPDKCVEVGIAEQNLVAVAAGMASEGFTPVAVAQAAFITMRAFEMNRQYLSYMQHKVILVGLNAGFYLQYFGNTHYSVEDLAIMRSVPGLAVLSPADAGEAVMALHAALQYDGPTYIRLTGGAQAPTVYPRECPFVIGSPIVVREGTDVCVLATGAMVGYALQAALLLEQQHVSAAVVDVHSLQPFDGQALECWRGTRLLVTAEEHYTTGGLGSAVAMHVAGSGGWPPLLCLGIGRGYSSPGDYQYLLEQHRLTPALMAEDIINKLNI